MSEIIVLGGLVSERSVGSAVGAFYGLKTKSSLSADEQGELFERILDHFPDMIHSVDQEGKIIFANRKATELLGYSPMELIGKSVYEIYAPHLRDMVKNGLSDLKARGIKKVKSEVANKSGEIIEVEIRSLSLYNEQGNFVKTFSVVRDMRELNYLKAQLVQSSKLASIGEFASGIMHDIKNPLMVISAYSEQIERGLLKDPEKIMKAAEKIRIAGDRIKTLSDHMRIFVRGGVEESSLTDLGKVIENGLLMLENLLKKTNAKLTNNLKDRGFSVVCRPNQIEQILINIIGNACDAMAESEIKEIVLDAEWEGDTLVLKIEDSGPGIPPEIAAKVFDAFFTTKPKGKGTGLGLSITNGIVREHGGTVEITTSRFGGAAFIIRLPKEMKREG